MAGNHQHGSHVLHFNTVSGDNHGRSFNLAPTVVIRAARGSDGPALRRLAELDSRPVPAGELLVAETGDEVVAALSVETGARVADPFRRTADVVDLLAYRARRLKTS